MTGRRAPIDAPEPSADGARSDAQERSADGARSDAQERSADGARFGALECPADGVEFEALEYTAGDDFARARFRFTRTSGGRWRIERDGRPHLELGEGCRLLRSRSCGVCSTDLDRRFLPFPLPQVIGHEIVAEDETGARFAVEINASHRARGIAPGCPFCAAGLDTHCPERLVLGIHDLPGGFGPWVLVPERSLISIPDELPDPAAALVEPFAAALRAVSRIDPEDGACIAVLGPGRLGLLTLAALGAWRRETGRRYEIVALARRPEAVERALALGADRGLLVGAAIGRTDERGGPAAAAGDAPLADVVIDTTGSPDGLALACALASREVHLKSTHGQTALGLAHLTEAVVDELSLAGFGGARTPSLAEALRGIEPLCLGDRLCVGWLGDAAPPGDTSLRHVDWLVAPDARGLLEAAEARFDREASQGRRRLDREARPRLPRVDAVVCGGVDEIDAVIRPDAAREASPVRPTGHVLVHTGGPAARPSPLGEALARGVRISTSRCGRFAEAVALLAGDAELRHLGEGLVTHRLPATALGEAFAAARSPGAIKVLVDHVAEAGSPHE